jgi:hypothetical protein
VKKDLWAIGIVALLAAGAILIFRHSRIEKGTAFHFVENGSKDKNFDAFPPEIPEYEFDETDFFS